MRSVLPRLCVFGDSIAWGAFDTEAGGWVERLKRHYLGKNDIVCVYNAGVSGDTSIELLARMPHDCTALEPDVVIIAIGLNDALYLTAEQKQYVSRETFLSNLREIVRIATQYTPIVLMVGLTTIDEVLTNAVAEGTASLRAADIRMYNGILASFAAGAHLPFLDILSVLTKDDLVDGLHPNAKGHEKLFRAVLPFIEQHCVGLTPTA